MRSKKTIVLVIVAIVASSTVAYRIYSDWRRKPEISSENLILNSSFEILKDDKLESWWQPPEGGWSVEEKGAYQGQRSMQGTIAWSWLEQEVVVEPEKYYTLQAYVKSDITITGEEGEGNTFLTLECLNDKNEVIERDWGVATAVSSWQLRETSIYASAECEKIRIKLAKRQGEGSVWFDELKLIAKPGYLRIAFIRRVLQDKPFWIFYSLVCLLLMVLLLRTILRSYFTCKKSRK